MTGRENLSLYNRLQKPVFPEKVVCKAKNRGRTAITWNFSGGDGREAWWLLDRFDNVPGAGKNNRYADNPSKFLLYQDVMLGLFDEQIVIWD